VLSDQPQHGRGVELVQHVDAAALEQRGQGDLSQPDGVEQRRDAQSPVGARGVEVGQLVDRVPGEVAVGQCRGLRPARRAGGVEEQGRIGEHHVDLVVEGRGRHDLRLELRDRQGRQRGQRRVGGQLLGHQLDAVADDERRRATVLEHVGHLRGGQPGVQRDEHRTEQSAGEERLERAEVVGAEVGHPVAPADTGAPQHRREPGGPIGELGVGERAVALAQGDRARRHPGAPPRPGAEALVAAGSDGGHGQNLSTGLIVVPAATSVTACWISANG